MPRKHPQFPEHYETSSAPSIAYSDHLPILASVPLNDAGEQINIISLNVLGKTCSGIHDRAFNENDEDNYGRYQRIAAGLAEGIRRQNATVVLLQEASALMLPHLQGILDPNDWEIIADERAGIISAYRKDRLQIQKTKVDEVSRIRSMTFGIPQLNKTVDIHNIWGLYEPFPNAMEQQFRQTLAETESDISIMMGDTNSRIAPLDARKRNITTGIIPSVFNATAELPDDLQRSDYPDGGFYRDETGVIRQLETQVLDFASGEIFVDERSAEEIGLWPEYRMVMCLDEQYSIRKVLGNYTVFDYEEELKSELGVPSILVRMAADSYNNQALAIRFPYRSSYFNTVYQALAQEEGFQFQNIDQGSRYQCVFAPIEKVELLHKVLTPYLLRATLVDRLNQQIAKLSESHWYFRGASAKVASLTSLQDLLLEAPPASTKAELLSIIENWEREPFKDDRNDNGSVLINDNGTLMGVHRNIFFSRHRPGELTATETLIQEIKYILTPNVVVLPMLKKLDQQIEELSRSHWYLRDEPEKAKRLKILRNQLSDAKADSTNEELLLVIANWENASFEDDRNDDSGSALINTNKALMSVHRSIFSSRYRPEEQTSTQLLIEELKQGLTSAVADENMSI